jgi:hypothetical protein
MSVLKASRSRAAAALAVVALVTIGCTGTGTARGDDPGTGGEDRSGPVFDPPWIPIAFGVDGGRLAIVPPACGEREVDAVIVTTIEADGDLGDNVWVVRRDDQDVRLDRLVVGQVPEGFREVEDLRDDLLTAGARLQAMVVLHSQDAEGDDVSNPVVARFSLADLPPEGQVAASDELELQEPMTEEEYQQTLAESGCEEWP